MLHPRARRRDPCTRSAVIAEELAKLGYRDVRRYIGGKQAESTTGSTALPPDVGLTAALTGPVPTAGSGGEQVGQFAGGSEELRPPLGDQLGGVAIVRMEAAAVVLEQLAHSTAGGER
jgi:hypothetical protein